MLRSVFQCKFFPIAIFRHFSIIFYPQIIHNIVLRNTVFVQLILSFLQWLHFQTVFILIFSCSTFLYSLRLDNTVTCFLNDVYITPPVSLFTFECYFFFRSKLLLPYILALLAIFVFPFYLLSCNVLEFS